jgi:putative ABC transport system ATP-binding protein
MIRLKDITVSFGETATTQRTVLNAVNLEINPDDFVMVLGTNGAGKSTLLNVISGEIRPDKGSIEIGDEKVTGCGVANRAAWISRVFQDPYKGTCVDLTVEENLSLALKRGKGRYFGWASQKKRKEFFVQRLRELNIGLEERLNDAMHTLSGGQRQAVSLVMSTLREMPLGSMVNYPSILLLDEHTSALDPKMSALVMKLTDQLVRKHRLTALMVTHDMDDALSYGNRLIVLREGSVYKDISSDEKKKLTKELLFEYLSHPHSMV